MAIPVFTRNENFNRPNLIKSSAETSMTVEGTISKTAANLLLVVVAGVVGWFVPVLALPAILAAFVVGLVLSFRREPSAPLTISYSALQGVALGGISGILETIYPGVVIQAVLATAAVFVSVLLLFRSGKLRTSPKMTKFFLVAIMGYALFSLVNFGLQVFDVVPGMFGVYSATVFGFPLGIILGLLATVLASYSLVMDFEFIQQGAANRLPVKYEWTATFGLIATIVWLYVEMLRLISILRN